MKKLPLYVIALLVLISCSQDTQIEIVSIDIKGSVTKGSYLPGSNISFNELEDRELRQTGDYYFSIIDNANGEYELNIDDLDEDIALAVANGYYWDEVRNQVSDGELDLVGIFEWSSELNVNVLSHLESERVKYLIQNDLIGGRRSKRFGKAKKQALNEVLTAFGIDQEYNLSESFSFFSGDNKSKILLAISSVLQADRDTYEIASLLAQLRVDIKEDGTLDNEDLREEIGSRLCILDIEQIAANVYQRLGDDFPGLEEDSLVSDYLDDIKAEFSGYECDPKVNPGPNVIAIGLLTEAIDENCNELTFFTDLDNDGALDDNETVINKITICNGTDGEDGSDGEDAVSIKVVTSAATDCDNGGTTFMFYLDANNNDQKDDDEVVVTETTICNGEDGASGSVIGVEITEASEQECAQGGQKIIIFKDSNENGELDTEEEVIDTAVSCIEDADNDGIRDDNDLCPDTPPNTSVDGFGCAMLGVKENGVTIYVSSNLAVTGEKYLLNGIEYLVVDDILLDNLTRFEVAYEDLAHVVTTRVKDLDGQFNGMPLDFNQDIGSWDVSNVEFQSGMFYYSKEFNQDIGYWDVSNWTTMASLFAGAESFNQDISRWDVSNITQFDGMFQDAKSFNQGLSNWNMSKAESLGGMFQGAESFNQDLNTWDISSVVYSANMFQNAKNFNGDITSWNTSKLEYTAEMFSGAESFNQDISNWNTSSVFIMDRMFKNALSFNQDLSQWCVFQVYQEPEEFDFNATSWTLENSRPVWGTCPRGETIQYVYLDSNDYTLKADPAAEVGQWYRFQGQDFLVVDNQLLREKIKEGYYPSDLVTTFVTDMSYLFAISDLNDPASNYYGGRDLKTEEYLSENGIITLQYYPSEFGGGTYRWDTSNVTTMEGMFIGSTLGDDLSNWDVSKVTNFSKMFALSEIGLYGNLNLGNWEFSSTGRINMEAMFFKAQFYNEELSSWDTSRVYNMQSMFHGNEWFSDNLSAWNTANVLEYCLNFNTGNTYMIPPSFSNCRPRLGISSSRSSATSSPRR